MSHPVLLDAGPLVAYLDETDQFHEWAVARFSELPVPFLAPEAVLSEVCFLLADSPRGVAKIGEYLERGVLAMVPVGGAAQPRIFALMEKYRQVPMSYADARLRRKWILHWHGANRRSRPRWPGATEPFERRPQSPYPCGLATCQAQALAMIFSML